MKTSYRLSLRSGLYWFDTEHFDSKAALTKHFSMLKTLHKNVGYDVLIERIEDGYRESASTGTVSIDGLTLATLKKVLS